MQQTETKREEGKSHPSFGNRNREPPEAKGSSHVINGTILLLHAGDQHVCVV